MGAGWFDPWRWLWRWLAGAPVRHLERPARVDTALLALARLDMGLTAPARVDTAIFAGALLDTAKAIPAHDGTALTLPAGDGTALSLTASETMSAHSDFSMYRGEDVTIDFTFDPVINTTGLTITFALSATIGTPVLLTKTASITNGPLGKFRVTLASADTAALPVRKYVWDVRRQPAGQKATVADGTLDLKHEVAV